MPYGIALSAINATADPVLQLWETVAQFERRSSMLALNYPPHITLAVYPDSMPDNAGRIFRALFSDQPAIDISFDSIGIFDNDPLVLWLRPKANAALARLHEKLHAQIAPQLCLNYYRPGSWQPHCTLAAAVRASAADAARQWAKSWQGNFTVRFNIADFVSASPIHILNRIELTKYPPEQGSGGPNNQTDDGSACVRY